MSDNILSLNFAPGLYDLGTKFRRQNVWTDGNRVRFRDGVAEPIGGWGRSTDADGVGLPSMHISSPDICNNIMAWLDNSGDLQRAFGMNGGLKAIDAAGDVTNITPAGYTPQGLGNQGNIGYGGYFYGLGAYGVPRPIPIEVYSPVFRWEFDLWGEDLLAGAVSQSGVLYYWTPGSPAALAVANAPTGFSCFTVTNERIIMMGGSLTNPRLIQWCSNENRTLWTPALNNQAGNFTLSGGGPLLRIGQVQDVILIVSTTDAHVSRYIRPPYIYSFDKVAEGCGAPSARSIVFTKDFAVWPGFDTFFLFDGQLRQITCPIYSDIRNCIIGPNAGEIFAWENSMFDEIWWHFPCAVNPNVKRYVVWNYKDNTWHKGLMSRVAGFGQQTLSRPIMVDYDGYIYDHELIGVFPGVVEDNVFISSGPFSITRGDANQYVNYIYPDLELDGEVALSLKGYAMPGNASRSYGPYNVSLPYMPEQPIPVRAYGHNLEFTLKALSGSWKMGNMRVGLIGGGSR